MRRNKVHGECPRRAGGPAPSRRSNIRCSRRGRLGRRSKLRWIVSTWNYITPLIGYCDMKRNIKTPAIAIVIAAALVFGIALATEAPSGPATDLKLAPGLSFSDDSSPNFPIVGKDLSDGSLANDHATVIFFGTANC